MCEISIIISIKDDEKQLKKSLKTLKTQTFEGNIKIVGITNFNNPLIENEMLLFNSMQNALNEINSEYVLFISETDCFQKDMLKLSYNIAKTNNLDVLYIQITDKILEKNKKIKINENFQIITPFNFAQFCKKSFLDTLNFNNNLFYEIHKNSKRTAFLNEKIYFRNFISENNLKEYTSEFLNTFPNNTDGIFTILVTYLMNYPLNLKQKFYDIIKYYFKFNNLNKKNQKIYNIIMNNEYLIDFLSEYKLNSLKYEIYKNPISKKYYKISVIIPIFNNETLIHRTLMSIENQTFGLNNIEVLMINDASTDNTKNVINEYVDKYPNFKSIHIQNGTGSAGTPRNLGLKLSSAEYILFIDHDDLLEINALEKLYNKITKYKCDFVYGTYVLINSEESIKFTYPNEKHGLFKNLEDNPRSITTPPSIWTKLFKKEFLIKNNILFPTILGEDAIFMAKALQNADGVYYLWDDIISYYNLNESSYSTNLSYNYFIEGFTSEEYLYNLFYEWGKIEHYKIRGEGILDFYLNRIFYSTLSNNELSDIFPLLHKFCDKLNKLDVTPKLEKNKIAFEYIIHNDLKGFLKFINYKPSKFEIFSKKILNKINKHGFW